MANNTKSHVLHKKVCTECGKPLDPSRGAKAAVCPTNKCRYLRRKRLAGLDQKKTGPKVSQGAAFLNTMLENSSVAQQVIERELTPIVREAITEDVMLGIRGIVGLMPAALAALEEDLASADTILRQKAYTLLLRYTAGHGALVPQADPSPPGLVVNFGGMPRPDNAPAPIASPTPGVVMGPEITEAEVVETLICNACGEEKPRTPENFVGRSDRCTVCHHRLTARARDLEAGIKEGIGS